MKKICAIAGILVAILVTGIMANIKKSKMQEELAEEVFRFHVLANSDSKEDQALKMKVKEQVRGNYEDRFSHSYTAGHG